MWRAKALKTKLKQKILMKRRWRTRRPRTLTRTWTSRTCRTRTWSPRTWSPRTLRPRTWSLKTMRSLWTRRRSAKLKVRRRKLRSKASFRRSPKRMLRVFARRPCPSTSPAKDKWIAISQTFKSQVQQQILEAGEKVSKWEERGKGGVRGDAGKGLFYHLIQVYVKCLIGWMGMDSSWLFSL